MPRKATTPINIEKLGEKLTHHPDQNKVRFIIEGLAQGFDIGYGGSITNTRPNNLLTACNNPRAVSEAIRKELERGHTSRPFINPPFRITHCSPIGAVPKPDGSCRLILDLSSPRGDSVNEGIDKDEFSVTYSKFNDAVDIVRGLGPGAFMAKIDVKHAFRICPVNPAQWPLLAFRWEGAFFVDTRLPFGSRSSPLIFNTLADILLWIFVNIIGVQFCIHYLDDYFCARKLRHLCQEDMHHIQDTCREIGVPLAPDKVIGPTRIITYLGIQIDAERMVVSLPPDKAKKIRDELLSLIGVLSFACKVIKHGRMFLRRLIDLSTTVTGLHHHVSLNAEAQADITWWQNFFPEWNGRERIQTPVVTSRALELYTDADTDLGLGAVFGNKWLYSRW